MDFYKEDKAALNSILSLFSCRDDDINRFLYEKSIEFERIGKSRTYLIFSEKDFQNQRAVVLGYFSLALKTLILPENIPKKKKKNY